MRPEGVPVTIIYHYQVTIVPWSARIDSLYVLLLLTIKAEFHQGGEEGGKGAQEVVFR